MHLCSAICIASEELFDNCFHSAPPQEGLGQCKLGVESDALQLLPLPWAGTQPSEPSCTPPGCWCLTPNQFIHNQLYIVSTSGHAIPRTSWKAVLRGPPTSSPIVPINGTISSLASSSETLPVGNTADLLPAARARPSTARTKVKVFFRDRTVYLQDPFNPSRDESSRKMYDDEEYVELDVSVKNKSSTVSSSRTRHRASKDQSRELLIVGSSVIGGFLGGCITTSLMMMTANKKKRGKAVAESPSLPPNLM